LLCISVVIQNSICSELEREKAELTLNSVPLSDAKSRQTVASLLQQLQKQQQVNVRIGVIFLTLLAYHAAGSIKRYGVRPSVCPSVGHSTKHHSSCC